MASSGFRIGFEGAEAVASTFASIDSFRSSCTRPCSCASSSHLDRRFHELGVHGPADTWFQDIIEPGERTEEFLQRQAKRFLERDGETARLRANDDRPGEEILRWRWMSLALPSDLMLAAADENNSTRVRILDPSLRVLEPTAHLHLHATAAVPFANIWTELGEHAVFDKIKSSPDGFANSIEWKSWLRRALIARRVLDYWMRNGFNKLTIILNGCPSVCQALVDLRRGKITTGSRLVDSNLTAFLRLPRFYFALGRAGRLPRNVRRHNWLGEELEFNRRCLRWMRTGSHVSKQGEVFREIWVQMTRIRVMLYRHLVQDPSRAGLDEFAKRFNRLDEYIVAENNLRQEVAAAMESETGLVVKELELRKAPGRPSKLNDMHELSRHAKRRNRERKIRSSDKGLSGQVDCPRITWTLHFIRDCHAERPLSARIRNHYATAMRLSAAIRNRPELLQSIRGLDVASRELSGPLWSVTWALHHVRTESVTACLTCPHVEPLRVTVHVGEDFRHLLSGLRAIHEPFWWRLMRRGDRIGHALALGWDPDDWCSRNPEVLQPRLERMFDLAWMLDFVFKRKLNNIPEIIIEHARRELGDHLRIWENEFKPEKFVNVVREIGKPWLWNCIDGRYWRFKRYDDKHWKLLTEIFRRYDCDKRDLVSVRTDKDGELLRALRDELARLLAKWRTPIEINPSSNLLVGQLRYPLNQPLFFIDAFDKEEQRGLMITLSADDPVCFATSLADEFAYAWAGLVAGGNVPPAYAHEWLERAARAARRAVF